MTATQKANLAVKVLLAYEQNLDGQTTAQRITAMHAALAEAGLFDVPVSAPPVLAGASGG